MCSPSTPLPEQEPPADPATGGKILTHIKPTAPITTLPASTYPTGLQPPRAAATTDASPPIVGGDATDTPPVSTATSTPSAAPSPSSGLSVGAVAGISVAATVVAVAALTTLACFIFRRRRKTKNRGLDHNARPPTRDMPYMFGPRFIQGGEMDATKKSHELDSKSGPVSQELDSSKKHSPASHELDGSPVSPAEPPAEPQRISEMGAR